MRSRYLIILFVLILSSVAYNRYSKIRSAIVTIDEYFRIEPVKKYFLINEAFPNEASSFKENDTDFSDLKVLVTDSSIIVYHVGLDGYDNKCKKLCNNFSFWNVSSCDVIVNEMDYKSILKSIRPVCISDQNDLYSFSDYEVFSKIDTLVFNWYRLNFPKNKLGINALINHESIEKSIIFISSTGGLNVLGKELPPDFTDEIKILFNGCFFDCKKIVIPITLANKDDDFIVF